MKNLFFVALVLGVYVASALGVPQASQAEDLDLLPALGDFAVRKLSFGASPKKQEGQWYVTESGYLAAVEEDLLDRAIFWAGMGDEDEFMRFIASTDLVFPLKGGLRVFVEKFSFSGKVRIRPEGSDIAVWTIREAIRSELPSSGT